LSAVCPISEIYYAEKKILATLPKMAKAAQSEELRAAFEKLESETEKQIERLEQVFASIDKKPQSKTCDAIVGITEEGAEIMTEYKGSPALDAGLLAAAQAVEHYEISRYGTLIAWAEELGLEDAVSLLEETLEEEKARMKRSLRLPRAPSTNGLKPPEGPQCPALAGHLSRDAGGPC
jgi:ferritin-like metal-binding protein YciE